MPSGRLWFGGRRCRPRKVRRDSPTFQSTTPSFPVPSHLPFSLLDRLLSPSSCSSSTCLLFLSLLSLPPSLDPSTSLNPTSSFRSQIPLHPTPFIPCLFIPTRLAPPSSTQRRHTRRRCSGNIYLDLSSASGTDGFYVGAKIEMIATGQWATIQHYNGYLRMALFEKWNKPYGRETDVLPPPGQGEKYRIYLEPNQRGYCRLSERPKMRQGKPCGQSDVWAVDDAQAVNPVVSKLPTIAPVQVNGVDSCPDGTPYNEWQCASPGGFQATDPADGALKDVTYKYPNPLAVEDEGGARCADTEVCVKVDKMSAAAPKAPRSGYACCPKSGYSLQVCRSRLQLSPLQALYMRVCMFLSRLVYIVNINMFMHVYIYICSHRLTSSTRGAARLN